MLKDAIHSYGSPGETTFCIARQISIWDKEKKSIPLIARGEQVFPLPAFAGHHSRLPSFSPPCSESFGFPSVACIMFVCVCLHSGSDRQA